MVHILQAQKPVNLPELDVQAAERANLAGKFSWKQIAAMHEELDGTNLAPSAEEHLRHMAWFHRLNVWDREDFKRAMEMPFAGKSVRWIANIPLSVMSAMLEANPEMLKDRKELHKWLKDTSPMGGAKYRVPGAKL